MARIARRAEACQILAPQLRVNGPQILSLLRRSGPRPECIHRLPLRPPLSIVCPRKIVLLRARIVEPVPPIKSVAPSTRPRNADGICRKSPTLGAAALYAYRTAHAENPYGASGNR
jgi:hypothetical protein